MLTRLRVSGFKNLVDVDVAFGPFTCIAGPNASGKSNLFDAVHFLSLLADRPIIEAARSVREEGGKSADVRGLFHLSGGSYARAMRFEAEMIVPAAGRDDLGQTARATSTYLRYSLGLALRERDRTGPNSVEVVEEELHHINKSEAAKRLGFPHSPAWRSSVVSGRRTTAYVTTVGDGDNRVIRLHQDGRSGRTLNRSARDLPRTVLSAVNAAENPTALLAKNEMASWRRLQLEPSALRRPDEFTSPIHLGMDGAHAAATLHSMARSESAALGAVDADAVYADVANRLSELIDDVGTVTVHRDDQQELLTLQVRLRDGTAHDARSLSDGTLRFLALTILEMEDAGGLICLEEPENGIHPARVPAMLRLLNDIAVNPTRESGQSNPLRQVMVNTHSPVVVAHVDESSLLGSRLVSSGDARARRAQFRPLADTWREELYKREDKGTNPMALGELMSYLNPAGVPEEDAGRVRGSRALTPRRVAQRADVQMMLPLI